MKRTNGDGTVGSAPLKDGRWQARYTATNAKGEKVRRSVYGRTREEASRKLREGMAQRDKGTASLSGPVTVGAHLVTWLDGARGTVRPRSWDRCEEQVRLHLVPTLGRRPLARLTPEDVQRALTQLLAQGLSAGTVLRAHAVLRQALDQAVKWGRIPTNVASLVRPPRAPHREMRTLSPDQARELVTAVAGDRLESLYVVAVTAGLRQGELLALRWSDVDLERGTLRVTGTLTRTYDRKDAARADGAARSRLEISEPKTRSSRRNVQLTSVAVRALRRRRLAFLEERVAAANLWRDLDLVFCSETGGYVHAARLSEDFRAILRDAGLPHVRFHDLRHTAATLMLGEGVHPKIASEMLGHSTVAITMDLYSHVSPTMQQSAAASLDSVFADLA
jgi:integrase